MLIKNPGVFVQTNVLLDVAYKYHLIIVDEVYGTLTDDLFHESTPYSASKASSDMSI